MTDLDIVMKAAKSNGWRVTGQTLGPGMRLIYDPSRRFCLVIDFNNELTIRSASIGGVRGFNTRRHLLKNPLNDIESILTGKTAL